MNRPFSLTRGTTLLFLMGSFAACKNTKPVDPIDENKEVYISNSPTTGPVDVASIQRYCAEVDAKRDSLREVGPSYFFVDKKKEQVSVFSTSEEPLIIHIQTEEKNQYLYLHQRRPVLLSELTPVEAGFREDRIFYGPNKVLLAETRQGENPAAAKRSPGKNLTPSSSADKRFQLVEVNNLILKYLYNL